MTVQQVTVGQTEADVEAGVKKALLDVMPWLDTGSIKHQLTFSFQLGHKPVAIDGGKASKRQGRLDILIEQADTKLAILELKRPELSLTADDDQQGLSYARVLHPRPPIVIVSNGTETRCLATHSGKRLDQGLPTEQAFAELVGNVMDIAQSELRDAIATLMGPRSNVWVAAVRAATDLTINELTGFWDDANPVLTARFHFSRKASTAVLHALRGPRRVVAVEGPPLIGKTHILREVAVASKRTDEMAVLLVEASGTAATGIAEEVARLLGAAVGWRITRDEARHWLETLGASDGPMLVIAVDGLGLEHEAIRRELEALTAKTVGARLKFVVEADTAVVDRLWLGETRRKETPFARRGVRIDVEPLDDDEFENALRVMGNLGVTFMKGCDKADEYRQPWLLRAMTASVATSPNIKENMVAVLPPLLSLDLFGYVREHFVQDVLNEQAATFARAVLDDYARRDRPHEIILRGMHAFFVRKAVLREHADSTELADMERSGLAGSTLDSLNRSIITGRVPELIASELARLLAGELHARMGDEAQDAGAADWLVRIAVRLPFGDVIGAQALCDLAEHQVGISVAFLNRLLEQRPTISTMNPGSKAVSWLPEIGRLEIETRADGTVIARRPGLPGSIELPVEAQRTFSDHTAWLILSHLASMRIGAVSSEDHSHIVGLVHPAILALVGTSPIPLRRMASELERSGLHTHEAPDGSELVCTDDGIIEPVTFSLLRFFEDQQEEADDWLDEACEEGSAALLNRIAQALSQMAALRPDSAPAMWARSRRTDKILPALNKAFEPPSE